jgi:hypothetical protein
MKLNKELLPTEKSTKEKTPVSTESWVLHDIGLKQWENEVSELGHSPNLIDPTAHSHTKGTWRVMEQLLEIRNWYDFNYKIAGGS